MVEHPDICLGQWYLTSVNRWGSMFSLWTSRQGSRLYQRDNLYLLVLKPSSFFKFFFSKAASHRDRHISKLAITSLHDIITELLSNRSELPHFWFHEALFKPLDGIMASPTCSEEETDQVSTLTMDYSLMR